MNTLKLIGAVVVLVVVLLVAFGRKVADKLKEGVVKRYATKAVAIAETLVTLAGEEKFRFALQWAMTHITAKWRIPIAPEVLSKWIEWAVSKMREQGKEIKATNVLTEDGLKLKIDPGNYMLQYDKSL